MLVAYGCNSADLFHAPEHLSSNVGTVRVIAEIFSEQFFAPVRSREARPNRYLRNGGTPNRSPPLSNGKRALAPVTSYTPGQVGPIPPRTELASASILCGTPSRFRFECIGEKPRRRRYGVGEPTFQRPTHSRYQSNADTRQPRHIPARVRLQLLQLEPASAVRCESPSVRPRLLRPAAVLPRKQRERSTFHNLLLDSPVGINAWSLTLDYFHARDW